MRRDGRPLGLIVIDLDDFKLVNDTRGRAAAARLEHRLGAVAAASIGLAALRAEAVAALA